MLRIFRFDFSNQNKKSIKTPLKSFFFFLLLTSFAFAERVGLESYAGALDEIPIAIVKFKTTGTTLKENDPSAVIASDLSFSNRFKVLKALTYDSTDFVKKGIGLYITGEYSVEGTNVSITCAIHEASSGAYLTGRKYEGELKQARRMAHRFSNVVYDELLGEDGPFETKIVFVEDKGSSKALMIMDYDGFGMKKITSKGVVNIFPTFADASTVIWTSFQRGKPDLYKGSITSGASKIFIYSRYVETSPSVSDIKGKVAYASSRKGNLDVYTANLDGTEKKQLTFSRGIDTSPCWSPNGYLIAFTSDRSGQPQIYIMDSDGMNTRRITFEGKYQDSPSWSPKGDRIAYCSYRAGKFDIYTMTVDGKDQKKITSLAGNNEYPTWSPDASNIAFVNRNGSHSDIYFVKPDGSGLRKVTSTGRAKMPEWSGF